VWAGPPGAKATGTITGFQVSTLTQRETQRPEDFEPTGEGPPGTSSPLETNMTPTWNPTGIFPMVASPIPWQLEPNMEANMAPNMDPHGTFPMVTSPKAGNQHGSQQNKTPLSVLREPSLAARLCMCGFGLQPRPTWYPTNI